MDPATVLPPEVLELVWGHLGLAELLNCRLVSSVWNSYLAQDPVWNKFLPSAVLGEFTAWEKFLSARKTAYNWNHGIYTAYTVDISQAQFAIGEETIYVANGRTVKCLSASLEELYLQEFPTTIVGIHPFANMVAFVLEEEKFGYRIGIYRGPTHIKDFLSNVNRISAGRNVCCFQVQNTLVFYDERAERVVDCPCEVAELSIINDRLIVKTVSPVLMGCNVSYFLYSDQGWENIWKGRNSPMAWTFPLLEVTEDGPSVVEGSLVEERFYYRGLRLLEEPIESACRDYFRWDSAEGALAYTQSEGRVRLAGVGLRAEVPVEPGLEWLRVLPGRALLLVYPGHWRLWSPAGGYSRPGPLTVLGAIVSPTFFVLWSKDTCHIYNFRQPISNFS